LKELPESNWCCGSAGIYNITQPEQSGKLLDRKVAHIQSTGCSSVATSNPGCHMQIARGLARTDTTVTQPVVLLAKAYAREQPISEDARPTVRLAGL
jgi:glycolate oxidase iron-sulfur subunit